MENKNIIENIRKKAKKTSLGLALALGITASGATPVRAYVNPNSIVIENLEDQDVISRKQTEAYLIEDKFQSLAYDEVGIDTVGHAIELSDYLNGFIASPSEYSNTNIDEILNVDIDGIYAEYLNLDQSNQAQVFAFVNSHIGDLAAIDGFTLCSHGTVITAMKEALKEEADSQFKIKGDPALVTEPEVVLGDENGKSYIIFNYATQIVKVNLKGKGIKEIVAAINENERNYDIFKDFMNGQTDWYSDSFVYQGTDDTHSSTVYLSSANDDRKMYLRNTINLIKNVKADEMPLTKDTSSYNEPISDATKTLLLSKGYDPNLVENAGVISLKFDKPTMEYLEGKSR